jgi:hypothetical protein
VCKTKERSDGKRQRAHVKVAQLRSDLAKVLQMMKRRFQNI